MCACPSGAPQYHCNATQLPLACHIRRATAGPYWTVPHCRYRGPLLDGTALPLPRAPTGQYRTAATAGPYWHATYGGLARARPKLFAFDPPVRHIVSALSVQNRHQRRDGAAATMRRHLHHSGTARPVALW
jgi:hypothetical protein